MENAFEYKTHLIAITRSDGGVSIMCFIVVGRGNSLPSGAVWLDQNKGWWVRPITDQNVNDEIASLPNGGDCVSWRRIGADEVPVNRMYRDAWVDSPAGIVHDMARAREVHREHIRYRRKAAMRDLDGKWMRATGQGDKKTAAIVEAKRQAWRDAPADPRIDAAASVEDLKSIQLME